VDSSADPSAVTSIAIRGALATFEERRKKSQSDKPVRGSCKVETFTMKISKAKLFVRMASNGNGSRIHGY